MYNHIMNDINKENLKKYNDIDIKIKRNILQVYF